MFVEIYLSELNYLVLFVGNIFGLMKNICFVNGGVLFNLGFELFSVGYIFMGFVEDLFVVGFMVCSVGKYVCKYVLWVNFSNVLVILLVLFLVFLKL